MLLKELLELNEICFGVTKPKINAFIGSTLISKTDLKLLGNQFIFTGVPSILQLNNSNVVYFFHDYCNIKDVYQAISSIPANTDTFRLFSQVMLPAYSDGLLLQKTDTVDGNAVGGFAVAVGSAFSSISLQTQQSSLLRGYYLEYDFTKLITL